MTSHIKMADTSESDSNNSLSSDDCSEKNSEVESTFDDSDRDPDYAQSSSDSNDENSSVCNFFAKCGLSHYYHCQLSNIACGL